MRNFSKRLSKPATVYIGNLNYSMDEGKIKKLFTKYGKVISVNAVKEKKTNRHKGIAFVRMTDEKAAKDAISALHGAEVAGRTIKVSIAEERENEKLPIKKIAEVIEEVEKPKKVKKPKKQGLQVLFDYLKR